MMTSDSEESDYEDARQHHDNEVDPDSVTTTFRPRNLSLSLSDRNGNGNGHNHSHPHPPPAAPEVEFENANDIAPAPASNSGNGQLSPEDLPVPVAVTPPNQNRPELLEQVAPNAPPPRPPPINQEVVEVDVPPPPQQPLPLPPPPLLPQGENEVMRQIRDYMNGRFEFVARNRFPMVDSDSDDDDALGVFSDDDNSDVDIELMVRPLHRDDHEGEGESDRAGGTSDGNDVQDAGELDDIPEFDQELPIRHSYLGEGMEELQGRVVLEEDATPEIPLIAMGQHLIPGQTLPLQVYHAVFQNAIRRCVLGDRLFGIVHNDMNPPGGNVIYIGALGTLAEIFEFQEESEAEGQGMSSTFAVKAKGRQRFNVLEVRRQADGNLMGRVRIRPEIRLESFVLTVLSPPTSRTFLPPAIEEFKDLEETNVNMEDSPRRTRRRTDSLSSVVSTATATSTGVAVSAAVTEHDLKTLQAKIGSQRKRLKYYAAMTPHPYFVYEHYDETVLVERLHRLLTNELKGVAKSKGKIPMDATDLSFWLAQNLLIDDSHRSKVLKMDCPIMRLRYYLELLGKTTKVISCRNCESHIADHAQIFSMSIEGPQGTYVNPHGFVHETLTVYKTRDLVMRGGPSTEASWFPGYSWTIVECKRCRSHIGWKFQAVDRLKPARFWGLARRSVISKYNFGSDSDIQESLETTTAPFRTPPNSANSEAYSTVQLF